MNIKPDVGIIVRKKQKFFWIAIILLIINFYFVTAYTQVPEGENLSGQVIMVLTVFNFPLFLLSIILGLAPLMYKKRYEAMLYVLKDDSIEIHNKGLIKQVAVEEISGIDILEQSALIWCDKGQRRYDLEGLTKENIDTIKHFNEKVYRNFSN